MLRPYQVAYITSGAGLSLASYRFVPLVNDPFVEPLSDRAQMALLEVADRAAQRARITRLRRELLARLALDRERRRIPRMKSRT